MTTDTTHTAAMSTGTIHMTASNAPGAIGVAHACLHEVLDAPEEMSDEIACILSRAFDLTADARNELARADAPDPDRIQPAVLAQAALRSAGALVGDVLMRDGDELGEDRRWLLVEAHRQIARAVANDESAVFVATDDLSTDEFRARTWEAAWTISVTAFADHEDDEASVFSFAAGGDDPYELVRRASALADAIEDGRFIEGEDGEIELEAFLITKMGDGSVYELRFDPAGFDIHDLDDEIEEVRFAIATEAADELSAYPTVEEILTAYPTWNDALIAAGLQPGPEKENARLNDRGELVKVEDEDHDNNRKDAS